MARQCAVMGESVEASLSPWIHQSFAKQLGLALEYRAISVAKPQFEAAVHTFFAQGGFGLNVTTPFKERAYAMASKSSPRAESAKAANILFYKEGQLYADNSDGDAFWSDLQHRLPNRTARILLIGAGGAARGIASAASRFAENSVLLWNRNTERALHLQADFPYTTLWEKKDKQPIDVIVNTLPPSTVIDVYRQFTSAFQETTLAYDISYYPRETPFLHFAAPYCHRQTNGLAMLVLQAADSVRQWLPGARPDTRTVIELLERHIAY